jgi:hypothetical protein
MTRVPRMGGRRLLAAAALIAGCAHAVGGGHPAATQAPADGQPVAAAQRREHIFRIGPAAAVVARMDGSWREESRYHGGELQEIRFVRTPAPGGPAAAGRAKLLLTPAAARKGGSRARRRPPQ